MGPGRVVNSGGSSIKQRGTLFFLGGAIPMAQTKVSITHGMAVGDRTMKREQRQDHGADSDYSRTNMRS